MPIFDYKCADCGSRFTLLLGVVAVPHEERCPSCRSASISRLVSRFSRVRSEDDLIDSLADPAGIGDPDDPKEFGAWMRRMGREMKDDLGGDFDELLDEIEQDDGESDDDLG